MYEEDTYHVASGNGWRGSRAMNTVLGPALPTYDERVDAVVEWGVKHGLGHSTQRTRSDVLLCHTCGAVASRLFAPRIPRPAETNPFVLSASRFD